MSTGSVTGAQPGVVRHPRAVHRYGVVRPDHSQLVLPEPRIQQVDVRFSRTFRLRMTTRVQPQFDVFNLFNANPVLAMVTRYGNAWRNATTVLGPRVMKLGVKVDF